MFNDRYGLPLTTSSQTAADLFVDALDRIFSFDVDPVLTLEHAIEADEGFALAHAVLALQRQLQGDGPGAKTSLDTAVRLVAGTTAREISFVDTTAALVLGGGARGGATGAIPAMEAHLADYPRDFPVFAQLSMTRSQSGAIGRRRQGLEYARASAGTYGDDWAFNATYAMTLQENDLFDEARQRTEISLRQRPKNATAIHPIAHVYFETNNHVEGQTVLDEWLRGYEWRAPYHCHLSWHSALFGLAAGQYDRVMEIWDKDIAPVERASTLLVDTASLLWRLKLYGCEPESPEWHRVQPLAEAALARPAVSFQFAHAALYYGAMADDTTFDKMIDSLRELEAKGHPIAGGVMTAFVTGVRAFGHGDYDTTATLMHPFADQLERIGGSNAQAEVYHETYVEACLRSKHYDWAETALRKRLQRRPSARDYFWLGRALIDGGQPVDTAAALEQARELWRSALPDSAEMQQLLSLSQSLAPSAPS